MTFFSVSSPSVYTLDLIPFFLSNLNHISDNNYVENLMTDYEMSDQIGGYESYDSSTEG